MQTNFASLTRSITVVVGLLAACSCGQTGQGSAGGNSSGNGGSGASAGTGGSGGAGASTGAGGTGNVGGSGVSGSGAAGSGAAGSGVAGSGGSTATDGGPLGATHVWEMVEIVLKASGTYANPYTDVDVWVDLKGPGFAKKVWGFWDGNSQADLTFRVRVVAVAPGDWTWTSGSNQATDTGLNAKTGSFSAIAWTDAEKQVNANRRGFVSASKSGHALSYADGTPFFLLADTNWTAFTSRVPWKGIEPPPDFSSDPTQFGFEGDTQALKKMGYNSMAILATSPNWSDDKYPLTASDTAGVVIRAAKPKSNSSVARDQHDEAGNRPFLFPGKCVGTTDLCADLDRINPAYFRAMDTKMAYLAAQGFVPYVEPVRRDHGPAWNTYHAFNTSFPRFINYLRARLSAYNLIYSLAHIDVIGSTSNLDIPVWKSAMDAYYAKYGSMPFGQITTIMAAGSTFQYFGHTTTSPWLQAHTVGNTPKDHGMEQALATCFQQTPPIPGFTNEPHYVGFPVDFNFPAGEPIAIDNSDRDNYLARSHAYGLVLNGGLAGYVAGTGSRWSNTAAEPANDPNYPPRWVTLKYIFTGQAQYLATFMLSEGVKYQDLLLASTDLSSPTPAAFPVASLEGWSHMMRTADKKLALVYFESKATVQTIANMLASTAYKAQWFDPRTGLWSNTGSGMLTSDAAGKIVLPDYPNGTGGAPASTDWALKLTTP